ncbi:hypothetical protein M8J76_010430 [Diaphorina citri]|nr:hypothetical protein M8J76_010430 [Diaphorina citri]
MDFPIKDRIQVENLQDGDVFNYSIVLLKGSVANIKKFKSLEIYLNQKSQLNGKTEYLDSSTNTLHFKCIVELTRNENHLVIQYKCSLNGDNQICNHSSHKPRQDSKKNCKTEQTNCDFKNSSQRFCNISTKSHKSNINIPTNICGYRFDIETLNHQNLATDTSPNDLEIDSKHLEHNINCLGMEQGKPLFPNKILYDTEEIKHSKTRTEGMFDDKEHLINIINNNLTMSPEWSDNSTLDNITSESNNDNEEASSLSDEEILSKEFTLYFIPRSTHLVVTPVYIIPKHHDGTFQAMEGHNNSVENACRKIVMGVKLIQCLMAMLLTENKTFQLGHEDSNLSFSSHELTHNCLVFHSSLTVQDIHSLSQELLWETLGRELMVSPFGSPNKKFVAFLSCTHWNGSRVVGHAAIGGGGLALFGTGCLHTWPSEVNEIVRCFLNSRRVDTNLVMDDSCNRGTFGGCFSTTLGSVCHEMGHTFDLGHTDSGLMGRGFDYIDRMFIANPPWRTNDFADVKNQVRRIDTIADVNRQISSVQDRKYSPSWRTESIEDVNREAIDQKDTMVGPNYVNETVMSLKYPNETTVGPNHPDVPMVDPNYSNDTLNLDKNNMDNNVNNMNKLIIKNVKNANSMNNTNNKNHDQLNNINKLNNDNNRFNNTSTNNNNKGKNMNITNKKENSPNNAKTNNNNNNNRRNRTNNNNNNNNNRRNSTTYNNNDNKLNINQNTAVNRNTNKNPSCSLGLYRQNCSSINSISSLNENIINVDFVQNSDNNGHNFLNNGKNNHNNCENFHNNGQNFHNNGQNSLNRRRENKCYESRTHSSERGLCNNEVFERGRGNGRSRRNCRTDRSYHRGSNERCENWDGGAQCSRRNEEEVFWSENCAVMLNYHRWLNSYPNEANETEVQPSDLKFDARRNTVTSNAGLRLIELRGHKALCLRYWSFLSPSQSRKCFILPIQYLTSALTLVAIDNVGSIVKIELR